MVDKINEDISLESSEVLEIDDPEDRKRKKRNKIIIAAGLIIMLGIYFLRFY